MKPTQRGFTLIELMIAVVIVAIIASIAVPSYRNYVIRGTLTEAHTNLADYRVKMEQFYQDNRTYTGTGLGTCGAAGPSATTSPNFTYTCAAAGDTYTATATGSGRADSFIFTVDESNNRRTTSVPDASWGSPPINCWVTKEGAC